MTTTYDNTRGDCSGLGIASAINNAFGISMDQREVEDFYRRHNWDTRAARLIDALTKLKHGSHIGGFKVKDFTLLFFDGCDKNPALELRHAMNNPNTQVLLSMWLRERKKGEPKIQLDPDYWMIPYDTPAISTHVVNIEKYVIKDDRRILQGVSARNNWSEDFGDDGTFKIKFQDFQTECCQLFEVEFERI